MSITVEIDLRPHVGMVRDQRQRPTCLVFAASAAHEATRSGTDYLSVEFLFYCGAQRSHRNPNRGLTTATVSFALAADGQPAESAWPYLAESPDAGIWKPPPVPVPVHKAVLTFGPRTLLEVRTALSLGSPVVLIVALTTAMYLPDEEGVVRGGPADRTTARRHALLAVGSGHDGDGEYILVRNSWGPGWGMNGHGWLHDSYLTTQLQEIGVIA